VDEEALFAGSDFDQTLSFNDSGIVLSEMLGIAGFRERVAALSQLNLVQQAPSSRTCSRTIGVRSGHPQRSP